MVKQSPNSVQLFTCYFFPHSTKTLLKTQFKESGSPLSLSLIQSGEDQCRLTGVFLWTPAPLLCSQAQ